MSQLRRCTVQINQANTELVQEAIQALATHFNAEVVTAVNGYRGESVAVIAGIRKANEIRGFGVQIGKDGQPVIVGDDWSQQMKLSTFRDAFTQFYQATAVQHALSHMGYQVQANVHEEKGLVMVRGVQADYAI